MASEAAVVANENSSIQVAIAFTEFQMRMPHSLFILPTYTLTFAIVL